MYSHVILNFSDIEVDGQWKNHYTGKEMEDTSLGVVARGLDADPSTNCALLSASWGGWINFPCQITASTPITCGCEHPGQMYLQLRGLCPDSNIDRFYVPRNKKRSGAMQIIGLETTIIEYDKILKLWEMNELSQNTSAIMKGSLDSYALGSHQWSIENDNEKCSENGEAYMRMLKLTGCREGEFTCNDGQCIR